MKKQIAILIVTVIAVVSCSAMPPTNKPVSSVASVEFTMPSLPAGADSINLYSATTNDTAWTPRLTTSAAKVVLSQPYDTTRIYTVEATNVLGQSSDYAPVLTFATPKADRSVILPVPAALIVTNAIK